VLRYRSEWLVIVATILFAIFYPIFISIYVYLPILIGFAGFMMVLGLEGRGSWYVVVPIIYFINLEVNLSLPMMLLLFSVLLFYLTMYERIRYFKRCPVCVKLLSVLAINIYYILILLGYDFLFDATSLNLDYKVVYSILFDMLLVVFV